MIVLGEFQSNGWYIKPLYFCLTGDAVYMQHTLELLSRYDALKSASEALAESVRADHALPVYLPEHDGKFAREIATLSLAQLWYLKDSESLPLSGVVCSSAETLIKAEALNGAKASFKTAVKELRAHLGTKGRIDHMIERVIALQNPDERERTKAVALTMTRARLSELELLRCYAQIRILPEHTRSLSFTWARSHSAVKRISVEQALAMANELTSATAKAFALDRLSQLDLKTKLAFRKSLPSQLRANISWHEDDQTMRKPLTVSGMFLSPDSTLPGSLIWRPKPEERLESDPLDRVTRSDIMIEREPYVRSLNLHLYMRP